MSELAVDFDTASPATIDESTEFVALQLLQGGYSFASNLRETSRCLLTAVEDLSAIGTSIVDHGTTHFSAPGETSVELLKYGEDTQVLMFRPAAQKVASALFRPDWTLSDRGICNFMTLPRLDEDPVGQGEKRLRINFSLNESGTLVSESPLTCGQLDRLRQFGWLITEFKLNLNSCIR